MITSSTKLISAIITYHSFVSKVHSYTFIPSYNHIHSISRNNNVKFYNPTSSLLLATTGKTSSNIDGELHETTNINKSNHKEINRRSVLSSANAATAAVFTTASGLIIPTSKVYAEETITKSQDAVNTNFQKIPTIKLGSSNLEVSRTIQGYWQLAGGHGKYNVDNAIQNMKAHYDSGITTLDTADIYGPSETIVGKFMKTQPQAIPCTKFCCFKFLDDIDRVEVKTRIQKVCVYI